MGSRLIDISSRLIVRLSRLEPRVGFLVQERLVDWGGKGSRLIVIPSRLIVRLKLTKTVIQKVKVLVQEKLVD